MSFKLKQVEKNTAEFEMEISAEDFAKACVSAYNKQVGKMNVPGFRKGKAPQKIIEQYYGEGVFYDEAVNIALPDLYDEAVKELKLEPVDRPDVDVTDMSPTDGVKLNVKVTVKPEVKLGKYKGIEIKKVEYNVTDKDVSDELGFMQQRNARIVSNDDKAIEKGDTAIIDFEGFIDGVAFEGGKADNHTLEIGSGSFIEGFEDQLIGKKVGDECEVNVTFPKDYHAAEYAGKDAKFNVKVNGIKAKELPALDDEFAKDVSEYDTLDELKKSIKDRMVKEAEEKQKVETQNAIIDKIIEGMTVDIPEAMVAQELANMAQSMDRQLSSQGLSLEQYFQMTGMTFETFKEEYSERALGQVKANLAIEAIGKLEGFTAEESEIDAEYQKIADTNNAKLEDVKKFIPQDGMAKDIVVMKTIDFLIENAKIK